jgi:DNA-binding SARP family transcriptional activator
VRVGLLGTLAVTVGGETADIGGAQARAVLAILALANRRVVAIDELVEGVWGGSPPQRPAVAVQSSLSRLLPVLEPRRAPGRRSGVIVRDGGGYRLMVAPCQVDVHRFDTWPRR